MGSARREWGVSHGLGCGVSLCVSVSQSCVILMGLFLYLLLCVAGDC